MNNLNDTIKSYEPMMHKIMRKFKIKRDYEDILQMLRIKTWEVLRDKKYKNTYRNKEGIVIETKLSTLMYRTLTNRLIDILKTDYGLKVKDDGTSLENTAIDKKIRYFLKSPILYGLIFTPVEDCSSETELKCKLDFENYYNTLKSEDKKLINAMMNKEATGDKKEIAKILNCSVRNLNRRLLQLKEAYKKYLMGGV